MSPDDPRHGTSRGYRLGCRKQCCAVAESSRRRELRSRPCDTCRALHQGRYETCQTCRSSGRIGWFKGGEIELTGGQWVGGLIKRYVREEAA